MNQTCWVKKWVVPSSSGNGNYIVSLHKEGWYACSCPGWTRHTPRTDCKHIREVLAGNAMTEDEYVLRRLQGKV